MKNERLTAVKKIIQIETHKSGHLIIKSKMKGHRFKRISNIKSDLTAFELNCVYIFAYRLISSMSNIYATKYISQAISNSNYAEVFGTPWNLK